MSFQLKVNGFGLPANRGSRHRHIEIREDPGDEFKWRTVTPPPPQPSSLAPPFLVVLFTIIIRYDFQEKCIFKEEKKFWIVKVLFIYIYQSMT